MMLQGGGTWSFNKNKLSKLLKSPVLAKHAKTKLYHVYGNDELFDRLDYLEKNYPEKNIWSDGKVLSMIRHAMKSL